MKPLYSSALMEAFEYAATLHQTQVRKGTEIPYITHLMAVASIVGEAGGTENQMIAALLHDAVEDHGGLTILSEIEQRFGDEVARIVRGCSDSMETEPAGKKPWEQRKRAYIEHLQSTDDQGTLLVSCADKLHNARSIVNGLMTIGPDLWKRFRPRQEQSLWYYRTLADIFKNKFRGGAWSALAAELDTVVTQMEDLAAGKRDSARLRG
ncbi:MAG: HD domain-containing protein [Spirochaetia bacterium]|nr:HD domain-containing protein [Spirochaetia bacterium]